MAHPHPDKRHVMVSYRRYILGEKAAFEEEYVFIFPGVDFISVMMSVQQKLDQLNEAKRKSFSDGLKRGWRKSWFEDGDEFKIVGIAETDLIQFSDAWIKDYVESGIVNHEEA